MTSAMSSKVIFGPAIAAEVFSLYILMIDYDTFSCFLLNSMIFCSFNLNVSLSGLFALWASCRKDIFYGVASVSGSFWYDGFIEWISENRPFADKFYFSLGEKEKESKNPRLASVDSATKHIFGLMNVAGATASFEYNEGNHFGPLIDRIEKAITKILA